MTCSLDGLSSLSGFVVVLSLCTDASINRLIMLYAPSNRTQFPDPNYGPRRIGLSRFSSSEPARYANERLVWVWLGLVAACRMCRLCHMRWPIRISHTQNSIYRSHSAREREQKQTAQVRHTHFIIQTHHVTP